MIVLSALILPDQCFVAQHTLQERCCLLDKILLSLLPCLQHNLGFRSVSVFLFFFVLGGRVLVEYAKTRIG
jgi:hypothetical protein